MVSSGEKQTSKKRKAFEISKQAQVLVFDEGKYGIRKKIPKSNNVTSMKEYESTPTSAPKDADEYFGASYVRILTVAQISVADMEVNEIWERLRDTVDDIRTISDKRSMALDLTTLSPVDASNLKGKERRRYMFEKVTRLGAEPPKKQLAPMNIRIGIAEKQKAREAKRQAQVCAISGLLLLTCTLIHIEI